MLFLDVETQNDWQVGESFKVENLKISYVGVIDYETREEFDFWEEDMEKLSDMLKGTDKVVGYNSISFDIPVIANYLGEDIKNIPQIDLMVAVYKKIGFRPKLDDLTNATLGHGKIGSGYDAVKYYASGQLDKLKEYCLEDVRITMELYDFGLKNGFVKYYDRGGFIRTTEVDWKLGENTPAATTQDAISMF